MLVQSSNGCHFRDVFQFPYINLRRQAMQNVLGALIYCVNTSQVFQRKESSCFQWLKSNSQVRFHSREEVAAS